MQEKVRMTSLVTVLEEVKKQGYITNFMVSAPGVLTEMNGNQAFSPAQVQIVDFYRFEHDTNPDDMAILYAIETNDGAKGTISNSYGTYADSNVDAFLKQVEDLGKNLDKKNK